MRYSRSFSFMTTLYFLASKTMINSQTNISFFFIINTFIKNTYVIGFKMSICLSGVKVCSLLLKQNGLLAKSNKFLEFSQK